MTSDPIAERTDPFAIVREALGKPGRLTFLRKEALLTLDLLEKAQTEAEARIAELEAQLANS